MISTFYFVLWVYSVETESQRGFGLDPGDLISSLAQTILLGRPQASLPQTNPANTGDL